MLTVLIKKNQLPFKVSNYIIIFSINKTIENKHLTELVVKMPNVEMLNVNACVIFNKLLKISEFKNQHNYSLSVAICFGFRK